jgi:hypothetical protein
MKIFGYFLTCCGIAYLLIAFNLNVSSGSIGGSDIANLDLMSQRQNHVIVAVMVTFIGAMMSIFAKSSSGNIDTDARSNSAFTSQQNSPPEIRTLENAKYRVWLVNEYGIEKNDVLGEVICGERSFSNVDTALQYAHDAELRKMPIETAASKQVAQLNVGSEAAELGITFDGEFYNYKSYRYQTLKDAVAYAKLGKN